MQYTEEQRLLIEGLKDKNLLVSAAAGSGKTMVLVERILHLITVEKLDIHHLLVVTFTKKAAAEMRERIQRALEEKLLKGEGEGTFLRRQLQQLSSSSIKTLHSFCLDIIRDHVHLLDLDPVFSMGESSEMYLLSSEALKEYLEESYDREDPNLSLLLKSYGTKWGDTKIQEMILSCYQFMHSHPQPFHWLTKAVQLYDVREEDLEEHIWVKTIKERLFSQLEAGNLFLEKAYLLCQKEGAPYEYQETLQQDRDNQRELFSLLEKGLGFFLDRVRNLSFPRLKTLKARRREEVDPQLKEEIKELRELYKKEIKKIQRDSYFVNLEEISRTLSHLHLTLKALSSLICGFHQKYREKKMAKGLLDYGDLEHMALEILENENIRESLKERYSYIFVDEYQDSNPVQERILHQIKREKNLFMVGDVRQSIYRFRLADPMIFMEKYRSFTRYQDDLHATNIRVDLQKNFRSRGDVIGAVNLLFSHLMSPTLGEMEYNEEARLKEGLIREWQGDGSPRLLLIEDDREGEEEELEDLSRTEVEAHVMAKTIKDLLEEEIHLPKEESPRQIQYRDIVILLRSPSGRAEVYEEVFYQEGIPLHVDRGSSLFSSYEVQVMLNLLRIIDNHRQDLPLISVLHSPIGGFTPEDLTSIRLMTPQGPFYLAFKEYEKREDGLARRVSFFLQRLNAWRDEARYYKISDFIHHLLLESGLYEYAGIRPGGEKRQASLRLLVDRAMDFERGRAHHLFGFLSFIDLLSQREDTGTTLQHSVEEDVVHLWSVHQSKGLEFPVVFLGDLGCQFNLQDIRGDLLLHKELGIGLPFIDEKKRISRRSLASLAIKEKKRGEVLSEELRILYVALTRAIDRLILVGSVKNLSSRCRKWALGTEPCQLQNGTSFLDWIGSVLAMYRGRELIGEEANHSKEVLTEDPPWRVEILSREDLTLEKTKEKRIRREDLFTLSSMCKEVEDRLEWRYSFEEATRLPSKISVTEVLEFFEKERRHLPSFRRGDSDGLLKGTVIHRVMRYLPLVYPLELGEALEEMVHKGILDREERSFVEEERILEFLKSSLGQRMLESKRIYREVPFVLKKKASQLLPHIEESDEEILVQGIIDAFFIEDEKVVLIDYKTEKVEEEGLASIKRHYTPQMDLYREAIGESGLEVEETYLYFFSYGAVRVVPGTTFF